MRISRACLAILFGVAWLVAEGSFGQFVCAQTVQEEKAGKSCEPCRSIEKFVPKGKPSPSGETAGDAASRSSKGIDGLKAKEVEDTLRAANACLKAAKTRTEEATSKDEPQCGLQAASVRAFISEIETVKHKIESAQRLQEQISEALRSLEGIKPIPWNLHDFPPPDVCPACHDLWTDIKAVVGFSTSARSFAPKNVESGSDATRVADLYKRASKELCEPRGRILDSPARAEIEQASYYTWTPTWEAYQSLKQVLETPALRTFCQ